MHRALILGVSLLVLAACEKKPDATAAAGDAPNVSAAASMTSPPKRKPGLWAQTVTTGGMTQTMKLCLDEATEAKLTVWGQQAGKDICAKNDITPKPGGWAFTSECDMAQANGTHEMEMTGTWGGACPANMKPGDMTMPNGMTMNIANLAGK